MFVFFDGQFFLNMFQVGFSFFVLGLLAGFGKEKAELKVLSEELENLEKQIQELEADENA